MTFKDLTVLVPTRRRLPQALQMLASYEATTPPDARHLIWRVDDDDRVSQQLLSTLPYPMIVGPRLDGYKSLPVFFNEIAAAATTDLVLCGNDDMVFETEGWLDLVLAQANRFPDGVFVFGLDSGFCDNNFPFSITSKGMIEQMGLLNDPRLIFSDLFLRDVAACFNRAVRIHGYTIAHRWMGHAPDATQLEARARQQDMGFETDGYDRLHYGVVDETVQRMRIWQRQHWGRVIDPMARGAAWPT